MKISFRICLFAGVLTVVLNDSTVHAQPGAGPDPDRAKRAINRLEAADTRRILAEQQAATEKAVEEKPKTATFRVIKAKVGNADAKPDKDKDGAEKTGRPAEIDALTAPLRALFNRKDAFNNNAHLVVVGQEPVAKRVLGDDDPLTQQMLQQLRPILASELGFVRTVCSDLDPDQRSKIKAAADLALKETARQMANDQQRNRQGVVIVNGVAQAANSSQVVADPLKLIRDKIYKESEAVLNAEQFSRLKKETDSRIDDRKKAAILSVISTIDSHLLLSDEQRHKIELALRAKWRDEWDCWTMVGTSYGHRYIPMVPEECVQGTLTDDQQTVWRGLQRINIRNFANRNRQMELDDKWWDEAPKKAETTATSPNL